jgi:PAS domain S-box-containing protein
MAHAKIHDTDPLRSDAAPPQEVTDLRRRLAEAEATIRLLRGKSTPAGNAVTHVTPAVPSEERHLEKILRATSVLVFTQDTSLRYTWLFNPQDPAPGAGSSFIGMSDEDVFAPEHAAQMRECKLEVLHTGKGTRREVSLQGSDGEWVYELTLEPMHDAAGSVVGISGTVIDATERRQADRKIRLLAQTVASTKDAVLIADLSGSLLFANESFLTMFGFEDEEVLGKDISIAGAPAPGTPPRRQIELATAAGGWHGESLGIRKDGTTIPLDVWTSIVHDELDAPVAIVAVVRDVTAQKQAEQAQTATFRIGAAVSAADNLQDLYRAIHAIIGEFMPTRNFYIAMIDEAAGVLSFPYFVDECDQPPAPRPPRKGLTEFVIRTGQPLLASPEIFQDLVARGMVEPLGAPSVDWLGVPLYAGGKALGALVVQSYSPGIRFDAGHREMLRFVSSQIAMAIERKRAEEALRESERRYRSLYYNTPAMLHSIDSNGRLLSVSEYWLRVMGYTREEVIGRRSTDFLTESSRLNAQEHVLPDFFRTGVCTDVPYQFVTKSGEVMDVNLSAIAERDQDGTVLRSLAVLQNVTERNRAERAQARSEERYRELFEDSAVSLWEEDASALTPHLNELRAAGVTDFRKYFTEHPEEVHRCARLIRLVDVNRATLILFGAGTKEEFRERVWKTSGEGAAVPGAGEIIAIAEGKLLYTGEGVHRTLDGRPIHVAVRLSVAPGHETSLSRLIVSMLDVSDRKLLQQQLLQAQKLESIGTLAGGIAHDFNNILGIIMGHASVLPESVGDKVRLARSIGAIQKAGERGAGLVRQILTFARKTDVKSEPVNLNEIVAELGKMLEETFPRTLSIHCNVAPGLPIVNADRTQVHQTLLNLCVNARDAMPEGGVLAMSTRLARITGAAGRMPGPYVCVTVSDSGSGMDETTKHRIFEPFFTTKDLGKGTGLGLSVVYGIMENHHGFIEVDSAPGEGTRFHLYFPVPTVAAAPAPGAQQVGHDVVHGTETLLVVEDEEMLNELLRLTLEGSGYTVYSAADGEQALDIFAKHSDSISLVITDIGLPRMSGRDVFLRIHALRPTARVIIATGYIEPDTKTELLSLGASGFLQKPYLPQEIARLVRETLKKD